MENETMAISTVTQNDIEQSKVLAGQVTYNKFPFIPILEVNNKEEKKTVDVDGVQTEVKLPSKKGFNLTTRNEETKEYGSTFIPGVVNGIILRQRYEIKKKHKPNDTSVKYRSDEFDDWNEEIVLYDQKNRTNIISKGSYSELKEIYSSIIKDKNGKERVEKDFELFLVLYINYEASGTIYRVKIKMNGDNNWFEYKKKFNDDAWASRITTINLQEKTFGTITYWHAVLEMGEQVDLREQIELQKQLNSFFSIKSQATMAKPMETKYQESFDIPNEDDDPIVNVEAIPF